MKDTLKFGREKGWKTDHLRPHRPRAGKIARQGRRPDRRNPGLRGGVHRGLARSGHDDDQGRSGQDDRPKRAGQHHRAAKHAEVRHRAGAVEGQAGRSAQAGREAGQAGQRVRRRRWPRSTFTRRFRPAAWMRRAWSCPPRWRRSPWASTRPSSSTGPLRECLDAQMVIFSGLKIDKLDDLEAMIARGKIRKVIAAGSLAMALKKAAAELDGKQFDLGSVRRSRPTRTSRTTFPRERIEQAKKMIAEGRAKGHRVRHAGRFRAARRPGIGDRRAGQSAVRRRAGLQRALREEGRRVHRRAQERSRRRPWSSTTACSACSRIRDSRKARRSSSPN